MESPKNIESTQPVMKWKKKLANAGFKHLSSSFVAGFCLKAPLFFFCCCFFLSFTNQPQNIIFKHEKEKKTKFFFFSFDIYSFSSQLPKTKWNKWEGWYFNLI